jgi:hypothetical protein
MGALLPSMPNLGAGLSLNAGAKIPAGINYEYFFDRSRVINAMSKAKRAALYKGGSVVMQIARRSITRMGMARPKLKVMTENPDQSIRDLIGMSEASGNRRQANQLRERLLQIQARRPSDPGTPPHTHRGNLRDRPGIVYAYDPTSESVVVGQGSPSIAWLAALHEFGGTEQMIGWAWIPRWPRSYRAGIIGYWRVGRSPKRLNRWEQTSFRENIPYPERPYMRPAFAKAISTGRIAKEFANRFKVGGL